MKIKIDWLHDSMDCETCGLSYAEGAQVFIDGALVLDLKPAAACFDGAHFAQDDVYNRLLAHLGHEVEA